jgi:general secretion pathway protein H
MPTLAAGISNRRTLRPSQADSSGFSLIEILVVVAIIGIFLGVAVLSTDLVNFDRKIEQDVRRLSTRIGFTSEEALMQSRDFGIVFFEEGYEFRAFQPGEGWIPASGPGMEGMRLAPDMAMRLTIDGRDVVLETYCRMFPCGVQVETMDEEDRNEASSDPQVVLFSSGEVTPFDLEVYRESEYRELGHIRGYQLSVAFDGKTELDWNEL